MKFSSTKLNILSSSNLHTSVFLIFTFVNICQNFSLESLMSKVSLLSKVSNYLIILITSLFSQNNPPTPDRKFKNDLKVAKNTKKNKCFTFLS